MDVYHDQNKPRLVAIGGLGLRNGSVAVLDFDTGEVLHGLTEPQQGAVVSCLAFGPGGNRVAYGTYDGRVLQWSIDLQHANALKSLGQHGSAGANPIQAVHYQDKNTLLSVARDGSVKRWELNTMPTRSTALPSLQLSEVTNVAVSGDGMRLAASGVDQSSQHFCVEFRAWDGTDRRRLAFDDESEPTILSLNQSGSRLAVGVDELPDDSTGVKPNTARVVIYDTRENEYVNTSMPRPTNYVDALAFDPADKSLAVAGGDDFELSVWNLVEDKQLDTVRGRGSGLWAVGISSDKRSLGFKVRRNLMPSRFNDQGAGAWEVFDLESLKWTSPERRRDFEPISPLNSLDGWTVRVNSGDNRSWDVVHLRSLKRFQIPLQAARDGLPRCYTFLKARHGGKPRIAVGHRFGISIFELSQNDPPQLVRLMVGHEGNVTAIAPSEDGQILVSCGRDQTIAGWSLVDWPNQPELGVSFTERSGQLLVQTVAPGSPGWDAGLTSGDRVTLLAVDTVEVDGGVGRFRSVLNSPVPGKELYFKVRRAGAAEPIPMLTTVRQRPLWRFFSTRDNEWVLWRWRDFFYDCSVRGDDLIGWQVNGDVDDTPVFSRAEQHRQRFHKPEKVEDVLTAMAFHPEEVAAPELVPPTVEMRVAKVAGRDGFNITVEADAKGGLYPTEPNEVSLWVNDHRLKRWRNTPVPFVETVWVPNDALRASKNRLIAQVYNEYGVRGESSEYIVDRPAAIEKPRLFGLCVGIAGYNAMPAIMSRGRSWGELLYPTDDAAGVHEILAAQGGSGLYRSVRVNPPLLDMQATRAEIIKILKKTAQDVEPDDVFVLFMAGHGTGERSGRFFDERSFAFVTPRFNPLRDIETGLRFCLRAEEVGFGEDDTLYDLLVNIPCRKLVLLDCCHSGSLVGSGDSMIRGLMPEGIGPAIVVACDKSEFSWDLPRGHGAFSQAILEIFEDRFAETDRDRDGAVTPSELAIRVESRVPSLINLFRHLLEQNGLRSDQTQRPRSYIPSDMAALKVLAQSER